MLSFSDCHHIIESRIKQLDVGSKKPLELYEPVGYILNLGGKRIRPVMTLMACNLFSEDITSAIKPALGIEVFHNFTLVHDDIMDNAAIRRNEPTVHARWNGNVAILSGDAMQIIAYQLMCEDNPPQLKVLLDIFNQTALEVCEGQQYDMNYSTKSAVTIEEYIHMIELKTSVLLAASLKIGALCGMASEPEAQKLYHFGHHLGLAFQIQDDYLDVYADQYIFGKAVGGDIVENKKTFLLTKAIELAKGNDACVLEFAMNNEITDTTEKIGLVRQVYDNLKIPEITRSTISEYSEKAFRYLDTVDVSKEKKEHLRELASELMKREK
jgi:geranylgeranyl diphosphate synthase, type II